MIVFRVFYDFHKIRHILSHGADFVLIIQFTVAGILKKYPFLWELNVHTRAQNVCHLPYHDLDESSLNCPTLFD
jgi:hypothetical protein